MPAETSGAEGLCNLAFGSHMELNSMTFFSIRPFRYFRVKRQHKTSIVQGFLYKSEAELLLKSGNSSSRKAVENTKFIHCWG